jgi:nucleotidyltransferase/DNA polymerase involved in DNA repair
LAKLASSASKPDGQTTVLPGSVSSMLSRHPPSKIPQLGETFRLWAHPSPPHTHHRTRQLTTCSGLGVKLGKEKRGVLLAAPWTDRVKVISDLASASLLPELRLAFGDDKAEWLHRVGQGIDDTPVKDKGRHHLFDV